jgi:hypothetical protein
MKIINLINRLPEEASCIHLIKEQRNQQVIICEKCTDSRQYGLEKKHSFQCVSCVLRTSIISDITVENSNLPIRFWMMAITIITTTKKGFSVTEVQMQLGMKHYEPLFRLYYKLRVVVTRQRDKRYRPEDIVEYDHAYVRKPTKVQFRSKLKRKGTEESIKNGYNGRINCFGRS